jgi:glycosyltransferase involved in cell wall biosynthesis
VASAGAPDPDGPGTMTAPDPVPGTAAVTVVIPTRNRRDLLLRTLHSVLRQREVDLSVVVVDEASTDGSADAVRHVADGRVRVVRHSTCQGVARARNTGIEHAATPWVAFVDDDDLWSPDKLPAQLDVLRRDTAARWACTGAVHIDAQCRILGLAYPPPGPDLADVLLKGNVIPGGGSGVVAATALVREVGGFDAALSNLADWDFYIRLGLRSPVAAVPAPLVGYRIHPGGMAHDIERSQRELGYIDAKYADERRARGLRLELEPWLRYLAGLAYGKGERWTSARLQLRAARHGGLRSVRSVAGAFLPERVRTARRRRLLNQVPADFLQEIRSWLAPYADTC